EYYRVIERREQRLTQLAATSIAKVENEFVGRGPELGLLKRVFRQVWQTSRCAVVTVYGDVGLGKSRLLQEALDENPTFQQIVMIGSYQKKHRSYSLLQDLLATNCNLNDEMPPDVIEQRIVRYVQETSPHEGVEATAHALGFLAGFGFKNSPYVRPFQKGGPEQKQMANIAIVRWFQGMARLNPLLIAVDNLQWVDHESLGMLEYIAHDLADLPVVILGAARPDFRDYAPDYIASVPDQTVVELERLSSVDIDRIMNAVFEQVRDVPPTLLDLIRRRAEGNPLFVEEFIYMLFDNGIIEVDEHGERRINRLQYSMRSSKLPGGLVAILQARLDELAPVIRQVLQMASVMGVNFWPGAFTRLVAPEDVDTALADLQARGMIIQRAESDFEREPYYQFRHTLYRDVVYSMLTRQNREIYHRNIAVWLESRVAGHPEYLEILAEHYLKSRQNRESLATYVTAAKDRFQRGLLEETLTLIEHGLDAAREVPREVALPMVGVLWMLQGQVLDALDRYEESSAASQTAMMLMGEIPENFMLEEKVSAARTLATAHLNLGHYDEAFDALNRAYSMLSRDNLRQHAAVLRTFGMLFRARGQLNESLVYQQEAFNLAQQSGDTREVARIMSVLSTIALSRGDYATALAYCERVLETNRQDDNTYYQILDLQQMASIYRSLFAYERTLELCDEAEALQARIRYHDPLLPVNRALSLISLGQPETGLKLLREVAAHDYANPMTAQSVQLGLVMGLSMIGDYEQCYQLARVVAQASRQHNIIYYGRARLWQGIAENALAYPQATETLKAALENETTYGGRYAWLAYYAMAAASTDAEATSYWYDQAGHTLLATACSLHTRPELQRSLLSNDMVRQLVGRSQPSDRAKRPPQSA
ncbi:MAG: AAA family ATPase, partial [Anaerolineae bacterium]|nr:AAA family ATPase [Anaerolineae bacterium]